MNSFIHRILFDPHNFQSVVQACVAGNRSAQRELFKKYFSYGKSICFRYTASPEEAEEVLNEGFLKVFNNLGKYDPDYPFKAWLRTIMVNTAISHYRKTRKYNDAWVSLDHFSDFDLDDSDDVLNQTATQEILQVIQQLRPIYRTVFLMNAVDGYALNEISELLNMNNATVRSHYFRARQELRERLAQEYPHLSGRIGQMN
ncbi:RNA polymerase, sigma-24 subunit, RpoE [Dyadobacter koreensis]|uniref:RNA polymerase, sigma-24 subunit, RpoE n=2 Tax=Dyadobacter koreensis TaxID=408657 RepID=A0A1H6YVK5_9BACT|nr:RNA polymerase, sigma-24 subunit, RpoE [Dyadobacter koreensis]